MYDRITGHQYDGHAHQHSYATSVGRRFRQQQRVLPNSGFSCFPHARAVAEKPWCATPVRRRATRFLFTLKRRLSSCRGARLRRRLPAARQRGSDRAPAARFLEGSVIREAHVVAGLGTRTFPGAPATKTAAAQNFLFRRPHESSRADAARRTYALRNDGLLFRRAKAARLRALLGREGRILRPSRGELWVPLVGGRVAGARVEEPASLATGKPWQPGSPPVDMDIDT